MSVTANHCRSPVGNVVFQLITCLLFSSSISAPLGAAENEWRESDGKFRARLSITDHHDQLVKTWERDIARDVFPTIHEVDRAHIGQKVQGILAFANCLEIKEGTCEMTVDFSVKKPDWTKYGYIGERRLWSGDPPTANRLFLGGPYLTFEADPVDPEGLYQFSVVIRNSAGSLSVGLERTLLVSRKR